MKILLIVIGLAIASGPIFASISWANWKKNKQENDKH